MLDPGDVAQIAEHLVPQPRCQQRQRYQLPAHRATLQRDQPVPPAIRCSLTASPSIRGDPVSEADIPLDEMRQKEPTIVPHIPAVKMKDCRSMPTHIIFNLSTGRLDNFAICGNALRLYFEPFTVIPANAEVSDDDQTNYQNESNHDPVLILNRRIYQSLLVSIQAFNGCLSRSILPIRTHSDKWLWQSETIPLLNCRRRTVECHFSQPFQGFLFL